MLHTGFPGKGCEETSHLGLRLNTFILKCWQSEIRFIQPGLWLWTETHMLPVTWRVQLGSALGAVFFVNVEGWAWTEPGIFQTLAERKRKACFKTLFLFHLSPLPAHTPPSTPKSSTTWEVPETSKKEINNMINSCHGSKKDLRLKTLLVLLSLLKIFVLQSETVIDWNCLWF